MHPAANRCAPSRDGVGETAQIQLEELVFVPDSDGWTLRKAGSLFSTRYARSAAAGLSIDSTKNEPPSTLFMMLCPEAINSRPFR